MRCPALGLRFARGSGRASPTLDRILNDRGYERGNIEVVSKAHNCCKRCARAGADIVRYRTCQRTRADQLAAAAHLDVSRARAVAALNFGA